MDQSHRCVVWWQFLCKHIRHSPQSTRLKHNAEVVLWGDKKKNNVCNANKVTSKPVLLAFLICRGFLIFWALFIAFPAATPGESIRHAYRTKWYHWWWWRMRREEQLFRHQRVHLIDRVTFCGRRETGGIMSDLWLKKRFQMHLLHCIIKDESGVGCVCETCAFHSCWFAFFDSFCPEYAMKCRFCLKAMNSYLLLSCEFVASVTVQISLSVYILQV